MIRTKKKISRQNDIFRGTFILDLWFERSQITPSQLISMLSEHFFREGGSFFRVLPQYTAFSRERKKAPHVEYFYSGCPYHSPMAVHHRERFHTVTWVNFNYR